jgi:hypothetical protein
MGATNEQFDGLALHGSEHSMVMHALYISISYWLHCVMVENGVGTRQLFQKHMRASQEDVDKQQSTCMTVYKLPVECCCALQVSMLSDQAARSYNPFPPQL